MLEKALFFLPCLYIFWLCKIFEVSNMEAISPLTAILTREQVGRVVEKIEPAPWITVRSVLMKQQVHPSHDAATLPKNSFRFCPYVLISLFVGLHFMACSKVFNLQY